MHVLNWRHRYLHWQFDMCSGNLLFTVSAHPADVEYAMTWSKCLFGGVLYVWFVRLILQIIKNSYIHKIAMQALTCSLYI